MKVALLSYGFIEYCIQQANGLARECEVLLLLPRAEAEEHRSSIDPAVQVVLFDRPRLRQPVRQFLATAGILRQLRRFQPDVIHFQQGHMWFNLALPFLRAYPLVVTIHDPRYHAGDRDSQRTPQGIMDFGFRRADRVIVHGEALKRQVVALFGIAAEKVHVIPHVAIGCPTTPVPADDDGQTVLFFGRIWDYKGLRYLIKAQPAVSREVPNTRFVIAGAGDDFAQYQKLMAQPEQFVVHNRFIDTSERDELFRQASVVVLPYIEATQSGVIPLAYSFGKPVIATRVGALAEAVDEGVTGQLVPPQDASALATAIVDMLRNTAAARAMGAAGREKLEREWSPAAVATQAMDVYRRTIRDRKSAQPAGEPAERGALEIKSI